MVNKNPCRRPSLDFIFKYLNQNYKNINQNKGYIPFMLFADNYFIHN